jgi:hypothetical protein
MENQIYQIEPSYRFQWKMGGPDQLLTETTFDINNNFAVDNFFEFINFWQNRNFLMKIRLSLLIG